MLCSNFKIKKNQQKLQLHLRESIGIDLSFKTEKQYFISRVEREWIKQ